MFTGFSGFMSDPSGFIPQGVPIAQQFEDYFRCYPISRMRDTSNKDDSNYGGKIYLPQSALHRLTMLNIRYPMLFKIMSSTSNRFTHSGVLEFTSEEGRCYIPNWMMETLDLQPGTLVKIQTTDLNQGTFVKLEPQSVDFLEISDPKAVLENALRHFTTLTVGDIIELNYNNHIYKIKILEVKPESGSGGICIIETDLVTDFAPPVGYVEPDYKKQKDENDKLKREKALTAPSLKGEGSMAKQINYGDILKQAINEANTDKFQGDGFKLSGKKIQETEKIKNEAMLDKKDLDLSGPVKPLILPDGYLFLGFPVKPYIDDFEAAQEELEPPSVIFQGQGQSLRTSKKRKDKNKAHPPVKNKVHSPETIVIDSD